MPFRPRPEMKELRFTRYRRQGISRKAYFQVLERDDYTCQYCGASYPEERVGVDHVIPVIIGGTNAPSNLVACCESCNRSKGDKIDAVRVFWKREHYSLMIAVLLRERDQAHEAAIELNAEARERFGQGFILSDLPGKAV